MNTYLNKIQKNEYKLTSTIIAAWIMYLKSKSLNNKKIQVYDVNLDLFNDFINLEKNKMINEILSIKKIFKINDIEKRDLSDDVLKKFKYLEQGKIC